MKFKRKEIKNNLKQSLCTGDCSHVPKKKKKTGSKKTVLCTVCIYILQGLKETCSINKSN